MGDLDKDKDSTDSRWPVLNLNLIALLCKLSYLSSGSKMIEKKKNLINDV